VGWQSEVSFWRGIEIDVLISSAVDGKLIESTLWSNCIQVAYSLSAINLHQYHRTF